MSLLLAIGHNTGDIAMASNEGSRGENNGSGELGHGVQSLYGFD